MLESDVGSVSNSCDFALYITKTSCTTIFRRFNYTCIFFICSESIRKLYLRKRPDSLLQTI